LKKRTKLKTKTQADRGGTDTRIKMRGVAKKKKQKKKRLGRKLEDTSKACRRSARPIDQSTNRPRSTQLHPSRTEQILFIQFNLIMHSHLPTPLWAYLLPSPSPSPSPPLPCPSTILVSSSCTRTRTLSPNDMTQ